MVSTYTPNINLEEPARGDYVGTWDTPVNANTTLLDLVVGGVATISLNNSPVVLSAAQYEAKTIIFNSTLTGSVTITFPTSFTKSYEIWNRCTGSSAFVVTLTTTSPGFGSVCAPPGMTCQVFCTQGGVVFSNLGGPIGSYWDYAGSSVPAWVSGSNPVPYLACTGGTFSSAAYPHLATILDSTTLPDTRGRARFALDDSAGRISSAVTGFSGSSVGSGGGAQATTLSSVNMPPIPISDPGHAHDIKVFTSGGGTQTVTQGSDGGGSNVSGPVQSNTTGITAGSTTPTAFTNLPPAYIGGIVMIRAA